MMRNFKMTSLLWTALLCSAFVFSSTLLAQEKVNEKEVQLPNNEKLNMKKVRAGTVLIYGSIPVKISREFYVSESKISFAQLNAVCGKSLGDNAKSPATGISLGDMRQFCEKLTASAHQDNRLPKGYVYRLPTEAEWEYVCRALNTQNLNIHDMEKAPKEVCLDHVESNYHGDIEVCPYVNGMVDPYQVYPAGNFVLVRMNKNQRAAVWNPSVPHSGSGFRVVLAPDLEADRLAQKNPPSKRNYEELKEGEVPRRVTYSLPIVNAVSMDMVGITPGEFMMSGKTPITLSKRYFISKYVVSSAQYKAVMNEKTLNAVDQIITHISPSKPADFCRKITEIERANGRLPTGYVYRLPTDAEWEYVARTQGEKGVVVGMNLFPSEMCFERVPADGSGRVSAYPYKDNMKDPANCYGGGNFHLIRSNLNNRVGVWHGANPSGNWTFRIVLAPEVQESQATPEIVKRKKVIQKVVKHVPSTPKELQSAKDRIVGEWNWENVKKYEGFDDFPRGGNHAFRKGRDDAKRSALLNQVGISKSLFGAQPYAFPAAADFPGIPKGKVSLVERVIEIDPQTRGWHSLGLYALPGTPIQIQFIGDIDLKSGYSMRIGCHTDRVDGLDQWTRVPDIARKQAVMTKRFDMTSPMGGMVYLDVHHSKDKPFKLKITNAMVVPIYILGETTPEAWKEQLANHRAPWGEIISSRLITTLSYDQLSKIQEIDQVALHLQRGMETQDYMMGWDTVPERINHPMRMVVDRQLSAGAGHAGYPFMGHMYWGDWFVKGVFLKDGSWGIWHELGHNHQVAPYAFAGQGEVTVNIYSIFAQNANGIPTSRAWEGGGVRDVKGLKAFFQNTVSIANVGNNEGYKLTFYADLIEGLGIEVFRAASLAYLQNPYPNNYNNEQRYNFLLLEMSKGAQKNLTSYFKAWAIPVDPEVEKQIKHLPTWLPCEDYPNNYLK